MFEVSLKGTDALQKALADARTMELYRRAVKVSTATLQRKAMRKVPVDTGMLKGSITIRIEDDGLTGRVWPYMEYAPYVELGTRFMDAQPYLRPALEEAGNLFLRDVNLIARGGK